MEIAYFDGETYDPSRDGVRLTTQLERVYSAMRDGNWHTLNELSVSCEGAPAAISARLRDLRKVRFGSHNIERRYTSNGIWQYRLLESSKGA